MSTDIVPFAYDGAEVRTVSVDGDPWWVAADIARVLGYSTTSAMTRSLDDDERGVRTLHTPSGDQDMTIISEPGLYSAIMRSTNPHVRTFKRWVTHEVLPAIRSTGSFVAAVESPEQLLARALTMANTVLEKHVERIAELSPKAEAWDGIAAVSGDYDVADAAKMLARAGISTGRDRLFASLIELRLIFRAGDGKFHVYSRAIEAKWLAERAQSHEHPRTKKIVLDAPQVRVTLKGLEMLRTRLQEPLGVSA